MELIAALFERLGVWLWFALAVVLMVLETIVPGIHFLWFGVAAAVVGTIALLVPMAWEWQLILFTALAFVTAVVVSRSNRGDLARSDEPNLNVRGAQYIGRRVAVEEAIVNGRGKVRIDDTLWAAEGEDAPRGASVEVTGVDGTVLVVANTDR